VTALRVADQDLLISRARLVDVKRDAAIALIRLRRAVGGSGAAADLSSNASTMPTSRPVAAPAASASPQNRVDQP
jgi:hypothetical protein